MIKADLTFLETRSQFFWIIGHMFTVVNIFLVQFLVVSFRQTKTTVLSLMTSTKVWGVRIYFNFVAVLCIL